MFTLAIVNNSSTVLVNASNCKQSSCLLVDEWINCDVSMLSCNKKETLMSWFVLGWPCKASCGHAGFQNDPV